MSVNYARGIILSILLILFHQSSFAWSTDTLADSRTLIRQGIELNDSGKYKEAVRLYRMVPEGDTNYVIAQTEVALSLISDSSFAESKALCLRGLQLPGKPYRRQFLLNLAAACDYMGDHSTAAQYYDTLLLMNPYDFQAWYEIGAMNLGQGKYDEAQHFFHKSLTLNPHHFRSHFNNGMSLYHQGRFAEAYLSFCFSLFYTTNQSLAHKVLAMLVTIGEQNDETIENWKKRDVSKTDPAFEEADAIINAKLALSKEYSYESILAGDGVINTLHMILEKVKLDPADTNFAMQFYMPFYRAAYDNGKFDPMILQMFSGYGIQAVDKHYKKDSREIKDIQQDLEDYVDKIAATQELNNQKRRTAAEKYAWLSNSNIFIEGGIQSKDPFKFKSGPIKIYENGSFLSSGTANSQGNKDGEWKEYYPNGVLKSKVTYRNGVGVGEATYYRNNGIIYSYYNHNNAGEVIEKREYLPNGILDDISLMKSGGVEYTSYFKNGLIEYTTHLKDDKIIDNSIRTYYDNGVLFREAPLSNSKREGITKEYFRDGTLSESCNYSAGDREGEDLIYYQNSQLHWKLNYHHNKMDGPYVEYNDSGKLIERGTYHNGRKSGLIEMLTPSGRVYGSITYKNDNPVAYHYEDETGKVLSNGEKGEELSSLINYHSNGLIMSELPLTNGKVNGAAKYYNQMGVLFNSTMYVDDVKEGEEIDYFGNGKVKAITNHKDGEITGLYKEFNSQGTLIAQGFLINNKKTGLWTHYYANGKKRSESFYLNGKYNGPDNDYRSNGLLYSTNYYDHDVLVATMDYDSTGKEFRREYYPQGEGFSKQQNPFGKVIFSSPVHHGKFEGPYTKYFPNGAVSERGYSASGLKDSLIIGYHPNGKLAFSGSYSRGDREGKWTYYDDAGNKTRETNYHAGEKDGMEYVWLNGKPDGEYHFKKGKRDGKQIYYGMNKEISGYIFYENGFAKGYSYLGKDGKELPMIPVVNGNAHVLTFYPNGQHSQDFTYEHGKVVGKDSHWYSNGKLAYEGEYAPGTGDADGVFRYWNPAGVLISEYTYKNDDVVGIEKYWNDNGQLRSSMNYGEFGSRHGDYESFDPSTGKKVILTYYYGTEWRMR